MLEESREERERRAEGNEALKVLERLRPAPQPLSASARPPFAGSKNDSGLSDGDSKTANAKEGGTGRKQAEKG